MVEIIESSLVVPFPCEESHKCNNQRIWLCNLDIGFGHWYTKLVSLFKYNGDANFFDVKTLKDALAKALVHFYPYAGRLDLDENGRPEIRCTGEGVPFVVARSTYSIDEFVPSMEMSKELVPTLKANHPPYILSMFQVTFMKCGGVCLGIVVHHAVGDGYTVFHYINTWSDIARGIHIPKSQLTIAFDRAKYFTPRNPPIITHQVHQQYQLKPTPPPPLDNQMTTMILKLSKEQLQSLKLKLNNTSHSTPSTFKAVLAHVWRCTCKAWGLGSEEETSVYFPVDFRGKLTSTRLPNDFFGNAVARTSVKTYVGEILNKPPWTVADKIEEGVMRVNDEYVKSVIDHIEVLNFCNYWGKCILSPRGVKNSLYVVSLLQTPVLETDFGWGKPVLMTKSNLESNGLMYFTRNGEGDGGVTVVAALEPKRMLDFKNIFYQNFKSVSLSLL